MTTSTDRVGGMPAWVPTGAAVVALLAHLMTGAFLYLASELVMPELPSRVLQVAWGVMLGVIVVLWRRRTLWVLAVPGIAVALWVAVVSIGEAAGWTA